MKLTTLNVVSPVASISLLIGSDVHHFVFTVYAHPIFNCEDSYMLPRNLAWKSSCKVLNYLEGRLVSAFGYSVTPQSCHMLAGTPLILESAYKITQLISLIDNGRICEGNSDSKFLEVAKRRDGIFKNHSGKTNVTHMANYSI